MFGTCTLAEPEVIPTPTPPAAITPELKKEVKGLEVTPDTLEKVLDIVAKASRESYIKGFDDGFTKGKAKIDEKPKTPWW